MDHNKQYVYVWHFWKAYVWYVCLICTDMDFYDFVDVYVMCCYVLNVIMYMDLSMCECLLALAWICITFSMKWESEFY